jgi:hypothetical protein
MPVVVQIGVYIRTQYKLRQETLMRCMYASSCFNIFGCGFILTFFILAAAACSALLCGVCVLRVRDEECSPESKHVSTKGND